MQSFRNDYANNVENSQNLVEENKTLREKLDKINEKFL